MTELSRVRPDPATLTQAQQEMVRLFWKKYSNIEETGGEDFYHQCTGVFDPRFIPHDIFYAEIGRVLFRYRELNQIGEDASKQNNWQYIFMGALNHLFIRMWLFFLLSSA